MQQLIKLTSWMAPQLLQGGSRGSVGVRHQQAPDLREHGAMAEGTVRARGPSHRGDAGGKQKRPGHPQDGSLRGGPGLCRSDITKMWTHNTEVRV